MRKKSSHNQSVVASFLHTSEITVGNKKNFVQLYKKKKTKKNYKKVIDN